MTTADQSANGSVRHILSLSGGKDSTALAIYLKDRMPELEYVFCDTEQELPETYDYLKKLQAFLGKDITVLKYDGKGFDELLMARRGFLPSPQVRWCTDYLKIKPFEKHVGNDVCYSYIGIRADEPHRKGYISTKPNIRPQYPFIDAGLKKDDIVRILEESGLGLPTYYDWRSRSGCYFCFFQQKIEWVGLLENHPDLYAKAAGYERTDSETGEKYTWSQRESLAELSDTNRIAEIKTEHARRQSFQRRPSDQTLVEVFATDTSSDEGCLICHL